MLETALTEAVSSFCEAGLFLKAVVILLSGRFYNSLSPYILVSLVIITLIKADTRISQL